MKKLFAGLVLLVAVAAVGYAYADQMVNNPDCSNNHRSYSTVMCPDGYRVQGVAYSDLPKSGDGDPDMMDAISPVCRSVSKGNDMMPTDFNRKPLTLVCDKHEIMIGVASKDIDFKNHGDVLDVVTAICYNPTTRVERTLGNKDIEGGRNE